MTHTPALQLTRANSKVQLWPVVHESYSGTRTQWLAVLTYRTDNSHRIHSDAVRCSHSHGHKTQAAAIACGTSLWRKLK